MTLPWRYRPETPDDTDWVDNPVSNTLAWASVKLRPTWCDDESHWTARPLAWLWTTCACCLFWRGVVMGIVLGILLSGIVLSLLTWREDIARLANEIISEWGL